MIQKPIREWLGTPYTNAEADELTQELNDRTIYGVDGYNSVSELGVATQAIEVKTDFITVTGAINLDTVATDVATNSAKRSYPIADENKLASITVADLPSLSTNNDFTGENTFRNSIIIDSSPQGDFFKISHDESVVTMETIVGSPLHFSALSQSVADTFRFYSGITPILQSDYLGLWSLPEASTAILDGESATSKAIPTVEWTSATFGAKSDVATNTSDITDRLKSVTVGEPTGSDIVINMVSLTQAEYDAGTPSATTFYVITDA